MKLLKKNTNRQQANGVHRNVLKLGAAALVLSAVLSSCSVLEGLSLPSKTTAQTTSSADQLSTIIPNLQNTDTISTRERHDSVAQAAIRTEIKDGQEPLSTMEIAQLAQPAVVAITTTGLQETFYGTMEFEGAGSGVIVSSDGYIVTNNHVIKNAKSIDVVLATGQSHKASLIGAAPNSDIAVIKIDAEDLPAAKIGNSDDLMVGELAVAVGNPLGDFQGTVTAGIISSLGRTLILEEDGDLIELTNLIQTDAAINSGNSGGGLFNSYGELIGINVAKASSSSTRATVEGLGFAIPMNTASPIINALVNDGYVSGRPSLNIMGSSVTPQMAESYAGKLVPGVWIRDIAADSCVIEAGMRVGDVIVEFGGEEVVSIAQLNLVKNRYQAGDKVDVRYYREGEYFETELVLDEAKQ